MIATDDSNVVYLRPGRSIQIATPHERPLDAFAAGRAAYVPGTLPQPPYPLGSAERAAWLDGWEAGYYAPTTDDGPPEGPRGVTT